MSDTIEAAVAALNDKITGGFDGTAKFVIENAGAIMVDGSGARAADEEAEVTLSADEDTFRAIMGGDLDPTTAVMTGRLSIEGDMGVAMRLGSVLG